jgi:hypothetical protein
MIKMHLQRLHIALRMQDIECFRNYRRGPSANAGRAVELGGYEINQLATVVAKHTSKARKSGLRGICLMKWKAALVLGLARGLPIGCHGLASRSEKTTTRNLNHRPRISGAFPDELISEHLVDLNTASHDDLLDLGLDAGLSEQIMENRPSRN